MATIPQAGTKESVPRAPMPVAMRVNQLVAPDGQVVIRCDFATPAGENSYFLEAEGARNFARQIIKLSRAAEAGLIIPPAARHHAHPNFST